LCANLLSANMDGFSLRYEEFGYFFSVKSYFILEQDIDKFMINKKRRLTTMTFDEK